LLLQFGAMVLGQERGGREEKGYQVSHEREHTS
jgi:hypothetical protein